MRFFLLALALFAHSLHAASCDIHLDENGVFHARGADEKTAYTCFGFLHGRERAFQVDYLRRAAQGRLAEILGMGSIKGDFFLRLMGLAERARALAAALPAEEKALLGAYTDGMNRGLKAAVARGVYEFKELGYEPEPWQPDNTISILLLQSFFETQAGFWQKLKEEKRRELLGPKAEAMFLRDGLPWDTSIFKPGEFPLPKTAVGPKREPGFDTREGKPPYPAAPVMGVDGTGSNSWVLSPGLSATGKAWFANDPHLDLTHPPFWFWIHVNGGELDAIGATVPGTPIIPSGFNRHAAWGLTDSYIEVGDIVAVPESETKDFKKERPTIWVKFGFLQLPFVFKTYQRSPEGWPVLPLDAPPGKSLMLRWTGFLVKPEGLSGFAKLMHAKSAKDIDAFFSHFELPTWNYVFADTDGNIGYRVEGLVPKLDHPPPYGVREGSLKDLNGWSFVAPDEMPHMYNPQRGWIVTANNRQWPPNSRYHFGRAYPQGFRGFRIEELLAKSKQHDFESLSRIQCDTQAVDARFILPKLLLYADAVKWGDREKRALDTLRAWDYSTGPECTACAIYLRWVDRIGEEQGLDITAIYRSGDELSSTITKTLATALDDLKVHGSEPFPAYKDLHHEYFRHISKSKKFEVSDSIATAGNEFSPNPAKAEWIDGKYQHTLGASQRLIVEMTSPPTAWFALAGPNLDIEKRDFTSEDSPWVRWRDCRYRRVKFPLDWTTVKLESVGF